MARLFFIALAISLCNAIPTPSEIPLSSNTSLATSFSQSSSEYSSTPSTTSDVTSTTSLSTSSSIEGSTISSSQESAATASVSLTTLSVESVLSEQSASTVISAATPSKTVDIESLKLNFRKKLHQIIQKQNRDFNASSGDLPTRAEFLQMRKAIAQMIPLDQGRAEFVKFVDTKYAEQVQKWEMIIEESLFGAPSTSTVAETTSAQTSSASLPMSSLSANSTPATPQQIMEMEQYIKKEYVVWMHYNFAETRVVIGKAYPARISFVQFIDQLVTNATQSVGLEAKWDAFRQTWLKVFDNHQAKLLRYIASAAKIPGSNLEYPCNIDIDRFRDQIGVLNATEASRIHCKHLAQLGRNLDKRSDDQDGPLYWKLQEWYRRLRQLPEFAAAQALPSDRKYKALLEVCDNNPHFMSPLPDNRNKSEPKIEPESADEMLAMYLTLLTPIYHELKSDTPRQWKFEEFGPILDVLNFASQIAGFTNSTALQSAITACKSHFDPLLEPILPTLVAKIGPITSAGSSGVAMKSSDSEKSISLLLSLLGADSDNTLYPWFLDSKEAARAYKEAVVQNKEYPIEYTTMARKSVLQGLHLELEAIKHKHFEMGKPSIEEYATFLRYAWSVLVDDETRPDIVKQLESSYEFAMSLWLKRQGLLNANNQFNQLLSFFNKFPAINWLTEHVSPYAKLPSLYTSNNVGEKQQAVSVLQARYKQLFDIQMEDTYKVGSTYANLHANVDYAALLTSLRGRLPSANGGNELLQQLNTKYEAYSNFFARYHQKNARHIRGTESFNTSSLELSLRSWAFLSPANVTEAAMLQDVKISFWDYLAAKSQGDLDAASFHNPEYIYSTMLKAWESRSEDKLHNAKKHLQNAPLSKVPIDYVMIVRWISYIKGLEAIYNSDRYVIGNDTVYATKWQSLHLLRSVAMQNTQLDGLLEVLVKHMLEKCAPTPQGGFLSPPISSKSSNEPSSASQAAADPAVQALIHDMVSLMTDILRQIERDHEVESAIEMAMKTLNVVNRWTIAGTRELDHVKDHLEHALWSRYAIWKQRPQVLTRRFFLYERARNKAKPASVTVAIEARSVLGVLRHIPQADRTEKDFGNAWLLIRTLGKNAPSLIFTHKTEMEVLREYWAWLQWHSAESVEARAIAGAQEAVDLVKAWNRTEGAQTEEERQKMASAIKKELTPMVKNILAEAHNRNPQLGERPDTVGVSQLLDKLGNIIVDLGMPASLSQIYAVIRDRELLKAQEKWGGKLAEFALDMKEDSF